MKKQHRRYIFPDGSNYPIVESTEAGVMILVTDADCAVAERHDAENCGIAKAAVRLGYEKAFIAGTVAYLVAPVKGEKTAVKFAVPASTRQAIKHFDETGEMPEEGFTLRRIQPSGLSEKKRENNRKRTPEQLRVMSEKAARRREGNRDLHTFRHLSGHVRTVADE